MSAPAAAEQKPARSNRKSGKQYLVFMRADDGSWVKFPNAYPTLAGTRELTKHREAVEAAMEAAEAGQDGDEHELLVACAEDHEIVKRVAETKPVVRYS